MYILGENKHKRLSLTLDMINNYMGESSKANLLIISPNNSELFNEIYPTATIKTSFDCNDIKKYTSKLKKPILYNRKWCVVFDNCLDNFNNLMDDNLVDLLENNKYDGLEFIKKPNVKVIINSKKCYSIYMLKKRMDYIVLLKDNNVERLKKYYNTYGCMFLTFNTFRKYFTALIKKSDSMIINTNIYKKDLSDYIHGLDINDYTHIYNYDDDNEENSDNNNETNGGEESHEY